MNGSPGHSRGGPLTTDRPTAENPGKKFTSYGTPAPRQSAPRHVLAESHVVAGRVRSRLLLLVVCECGARHVHYGPLGMVAGVRQAACGRRYTLHTGYELARVVA